ncbi:putative non-specific serine/threonine protein kinase [Helianthus anomalus]
MREFVKFSRLKQFALRALASTLDEEELSDLKDQFDAIDVDKSGAISLEEMKEVCLTPKVKLNIITALCTLLYLN